MGITTITIFNKKLIINNNIKKLINSLKLISLMDIINHNSIHQVDFLSLLLLIAINNKVEINK